MGRHHIKLPDHLYISPPPPPPPAPSTNLASISSFFSSVASLSYSSISLQLGTTFTADALERHVPGYKTSATFFTALRENLDLQAEYCDSPVNSPNVLRPINRALLAEPLTLPSPVTQVMSIPTTFTDADLAPPSALNIPKATFEPESEQEAQETRDPNAIPELVTLPANDERSRIEALRLVADSVAQQRQRASRALIFHPITFGLLAFAIAMLRLNFYKGQTSDYLIIGTTTAGVLMTILVTIRAFTGGYIEEAERVGTWRWLGLGRAPDTEAETGQKILGDGYDEILVTKFGDQPIGAIIFRGIQPIATSKKSNRKSNSGQQTRTEIRAWTVHQKYRGKGVGTALLQDAIKIADKKGWTQGGVEVASDHANSKVILHKVFGAFVQNNTERAGLYVRKQMEEFEKTARGGKGKDRS